MLGKQCCCDNSQKMSERERFVSAPAHIRDSFLGSSFGFGGLWTRGCLRARFEVINKFECSIFNVCLPHSALHPFVGVFLCTCAVKCICRTIHVNNSVGFFSHNYCGDSVEPVLSYSKNWLVNTLAEIWNSNEESNFLLIAFTA